MNLTHKYIDQIASHESIDLEVSAHDRMQSQFNGLDYDIRCFRRSAFGGMRYGFTDRDTMQKQLIDRFGERIDKLTGDIVTMGYRRQLDPRTMAWWIMRLDRFKYLEPVYCTRPVSAE